MTTVVAPSVAASHADHTYDYDERFAPSLLPSSHTVTRAHDYHLSGLSKDTEIAATLTWPDDAGKDLDLRLRGPSQVCKIFWPSGTCLRDRGGTVACNGYVDSLEVQDGREEIVFVTDQAGDWRLSVAASTLLPFVSADYELTVTVSEPHPGVQGPDSTVYLRGYGHCDAVQ